LKPLKPLILAIVALSILSAISIRVYADAKSSAIKSTSNNLPVNITSNFTPKLTTDKAVMDYFHKLLPTTTIDKIYTSPYPDTYILVMGSNILYGNVNSAYLTSGHMFNVYTQDDITANLQKANAPKIDITKINISDALQAKSPNKVNKKLIVFVDPDCKYCRQLEQQMVEARVSDKADIYYMVMPLPTHPQAKTHTNNILCSTTPVKTLQDYMLHNKENPEFKLIPDCNIEPVLERTGSTARELRINAVPVIVTGNGDLIMGADINAIKEYLK